MSNSEALPRSFNYCLGHVLQLVDSEYSFDLSEQPIRQTEVAVGVRMIAAVVCASKSWSRRRTPGGLARAIASLAEVTLHFVGRSNGRTGVEDRRLAVDLLLLAYNDVVVGRERFADTWCAETQA